MLFAVLDLVPAEGLKVALPGPAAEPCSSVVHIRHFVDIFCRLGVVVATAAFATSKFFGANGPRIFFASEPRQGCVWKPEVLAISAAWKEAIAAEKLLDERRMQLREPKGPIEPRTLPAPAAPTKAERGAHNVTHLPPAR